MSVRLSGPTGATPTKILNFPTIDSKLETKKRRNGGAKARQRLSGSLGLL
jgi:hypothetical protein